MIVQLMIVHTNTHKNERIISLQVACCRLANGEGRTDDNMKCHKYDTRQI